VVGSGAVDCVVSAERTLQLAVRLGGLQEIGLGEGLDDVTHNVVAQGCLVDVLVLNEIGDRTINDLPSW
jgi:hypothetical protein